MNNLLYNMLILHHSKKHKPDIHCVDALIVAFIIFVVCLLSIPHSTIINALYIIVYPINTLVLIFAVCDDDGDMSNGKFGIIMTFIMVMALGNAAAYVTCVGDMADHILHHTPRSSESIMNLIYIMGYIYAPIIGVMGSKSLNTHMKKAVHEAMETTTRHAYMDMMHRLPAWIHPYILSGTTSSKP